MSGRRIRSSYLIVLCLGFCPVGMLQAQDSVSIRWRSDYNLVRKEAIQKKLPILIDFGTDNCFWCQKLDETTFRDPNVSSLLNQRFIPLKVNADRDPALAQILRIHSYPTLVLAGPDGRILDTLVGYQNAERMNEILHRTLASLSEPDWMQRDYQLAKKFLDENDTPRAISLLRSIVEDGRNRPVQVSSQNLLKELESTGQKRLAEARLQLNSGETSKAVDALTKMVQRYPGLGSAKEASDLLAHLAQNTDMRQQKRNDRARELLAQAEQFYETKEYIPCLDRCEILMASYGDLTEGQKALQISATIKSDPEWLQNACDVLGDRLGVLYLALADSLLKRGDTERAKMYLERTIRAFPGSRQAESAQIRLGQLAGVPPRKVEVNAGVSVP